MAYNIILGRPTLNAAKAVIVPHLMLMKFECSDGTVCWANLWGPTGRERVLFDNTKANYFKDRRPKRERLMSR